MMITLRLYSALHHHEKIQNIKVLVWVLLWAWMQCGVGGECPKECECKWKDGKEAVSCIGAQFIDIPRHLDPSTQVLDLKHNNLQVLPRDAFAESGLVNLQKLWLNHCNLKHIERGAFKMLANLVELDLSHNLLRVVPTAALVDITGLRELRLSSNDLTAIPADAFNPLPDLVHLDLSRNRIHDVHYKAFRCLSTLEILKLSGNMISHLQHKLLIPLKALHGLNLNENPWNCNCRLRPLRRWMLKHKISSVVPPTCSSPRRLSGTTWQALTLDEFVCVPQVTAITPKSSVSQGENVSLVCRVDADIEVSVTWLVGGRPLGNMLSQRIRLAKQISDNRTSLISNLTIVEALPKDTSTYTCVADNKEGRSETNLTLEVIPNETTTDSPVFNRVYMTGGLLSGLGVLVTILLLVSCVIHRRQRVRRFRRQEEDREGRVIQAPPPPKSAANTQPKRTPSTMVRKPSDYVVIPSGDSDMTPLHPLRDEHSWLQREAINGGYARNYVGNGGYDSTLERDRYRDDIVDDLQDHQRSPSTISYVELPSVELPRRSEISDKESLKNLEFETDILRRECSPTGSIVSVVSNGQLNDLLTLPYSRRIDLQSFHPVSYNSIARKHRPYMGDDRRQDRHMYDPSLNARSYSALNLAMSDASSLALLHPRWRRYPYLSSNPRLDRSDPSFSRPHDTRRLRRLMATGRGVYRSLEGAGDLANAYHRYPYHPGQIENYIKEYRRLARWKDRRDTIHLGGGSTSRLAGLHDDLRRSRGGSLTRDMAGITGRLSRTGSLTHDFTSSYGRDITDSLGRPVTGTLSRTGSLTRDGTIGRDVPRKLSRDLTTSLTRDVTKSLTRDVASSIARDVTSSIARDIAGTLSRDVSDTLSRDVSSGLGRDGVAGVDLFSDEASPSTPSSPYIDIGIKSNRPRAATEPILDVSRSRVLGHRRTGSRSEKVRSAIQARILSPSDSMIDTMESRVLDSDDGLREGLPGRGIPSHETVIDVKMRKLSGPTDPSLDTPRTEPLRSILKNRYEGGGLLYQDYTNSAYYDDEDDGGGTLESPYSPTDYKDYLDHGS